MAECSGQDRACLSHLALHDALGVAVAERRDGEAHGALAVALLEELLLQRVHPPQVQLQRRGDVALHRTTRTMDASKVLSASCTATTLCGPSTGPPPTLAPTLAARATHQVGALERHLQAQRAVVLRHGMQALAAELRVRGARRSVAAVPAVPAWRPRARRTVRVLDVVRARAKALPLAHASSCAAGTWRTRTGWT